MSKRTKKSPQPAEKTIEAVFDEFLEEQRKRLKPSTVRKYEDIIDLFRSCLDGYAYQGLNKQEDALFDRLYNAEGDEHREFCQVFGPEITLPLRQWSRANCIFPVFPEMTR